MALLDWVTDNRDLIGDVYDPVYWYPAWLQGAMVGAFLYVYHYAVVLDYYPIIVRRLRQWTDSRLSSI